MAAANSSTKMLKGGGSGEGPVIGNGSFGGGGGGKALSIALVHKQAALRVLAFSDMIEPCEVSY